MYVHRPLPDSHAGESVAARQTAGLVGMIVILLLLVASLFLVRQLRASAALQDCVMSGRTNCGAAITEIR